MSCVPCVFPLFEDDHLTRIHLRLGLEDLGFRVEETGGELRVLDPHAAQPAAGAAEPDAESDADRWAETLATGIFRSFPSP